ncbi:MAG: UDP-2,4-diacetamido-2,4,6-trideoxy-beta-L-altropyranose hydrolase [Burkholderiales bacterium]|nr:UDP-2,4-diacetamido-2,4,6-trideoxy-beta-L-altropyranose hydrolase [Burkholderiales bacterium]
MNVIFRVDASHKIGTGHFMRCMTLAAQLKQSASGSIFFASRELPSYLQLALSSAKIHYIELDSNIGMSSTEDETVNNEWLPVSQSRDALDTSYALKDIDVDWIIIDHYGLDENWEKSVRKITKHIFVIDDLANRPHDCDYLLDQNFYFESDKRYKELVPTHCTLLLGPKYALIRPQFAIQRKSITPKNGDFSGIFVFFGGVDSEDYTSKTITALSQLTLQGIKVDVVVGSGNPHKNRVAALCRDYSYIYHEQIDNIEELMGSASIGIGAGGSATWERCCLGLPTIVICIADNQRELIAYGASKGIFLCPEINSYDSDIKLHISALIKNPNLCIALSENSMNLVDGKGVSRVARLIDTTKLAVRLATTADSQSIFNWRNDESIRSVSKNKSLISFDDHEKWFLKVISSDSKSLLVCHDANVPVGIVRFDIESETAEVSIYRVPGALTQGKGQHILKCAEEWLRVNQPHITTINAHVLPGNESSVDLFSNSGYKLDYFSYQKSIDNI